MNWAEIQGNWEAMRPLLQTHWQRLTDEDLAEMAGSRAGLTNALRRRYGWSQEGAEEAICAFEEDVRFPGAVK
jgi:uncharacterized protein YjbJ (UPF0337 family)